MSYTHPSGIPQGVAYETPNLLREALIGEIIAINDYSHHILLCPVSEISKILTHIMEEEKEHYGKLLELIRKSDDIQMEKYINVIEHHRSRRKSIKHVRSYDDEKIHMINLLNFIRLDVKGELEAIISYEDSLRKISNSNIAKIVENITGDEKEHVEELTKILLKYDKHNYGPIE